MRTWILVVTAVVLAVLVFLQTRSDAPSPHELARAAAASPHATARPVVLPAHRTWAPGIDRTYALDFTTKLVGEAQTIDVRLRGELQTTVVDDSDEHATLRIAIARPSLAAGNEPVPAAMLAELAQPWFVELDDSGRIAAAWFAGDVGRASRDMLKTVAAYLQYAGEDGRRIEQDATGTYEADYTRTAQEVERTKARYASIVTARGLARPEDVGGPTVEASHAVFALDADGWPTRSAVDERMRVTMTQTKQTLVATACLHADQQAAALRRDLVGSFAAARPHLKRYEPIAETTDAAAVAGDHDRRELGDATYDQLMAGLTGARDEHDEATLQRKLRALFALHDADALRAAAVLRDPNASITTKRTVIAALAASGTPAAQQVLVESLAATDNVDLRQQTLGSLGMVETPTGDTVAALEALSDAPHATGDEHTALLAVGNMAHRMAHDDEDAVSWLLQRLASAESREEIIVCLRALGNAADPRAIPAISNALHAPDPDVRGAAVAALRLIDDPAVDSMIGAVLLGDTAASVRTEAVLAASFRSLDRTVGALGGALHRDPAPQVRMAIVELLGARRRDYQGCDGLLGWASEHDADGSVRDAAARALRS